MTNTRQEIIDAIDSAIRNGKVKSLRALSTAAGIPYSRLYDFHAGRVQMIGGETLDKVREALNVPTDADKPNIVPLVGYVGAGAEVHPIDDHAKGACLEEIEAPQGMNLYGYVAVRVRGDSMYPRYFEGEVIAFKRVTDWDERCLNNECVVKLRDGRTFVKMVRAGSKDGLFRLDSHNAPSIEDVEIEWAACGLLRL